MEPSSRSKGAALLALAVLLGVASAGCRRTLRLTWQQNLVQYRGRPGAIFQVVCPPGGSAGSLWGTDVYSDDSSVCTAGVHSGRISFLTGGSFAVRTAVGAPQYQGSIRNGVRTNNYGSWAGSFVLVDGPAPGLVAQPLSAEIPPMGDQMAAPPVNFQPGVPTPVSWTTNAASLRGRVGMNYLAVCPPNPMPSGSVWGTDVYSDDSSLCLAAVHAGRLQAATGGVVPFWIQPGASAYLPSSRNGVNSSNFGAWGGSFTFTPAMPMNAVPTIPAPPGTTGIGWSDNGTRFRSMVGQAQALFCPPGGTPGSVWGSGPYTDDSSVCTAAVHAGLFTFASGGVVRLTPTPGLPMYAPSAQNGVNAMQFGQFSGSYVLTR